MKNEKIKYFTYKAENGDEYIAKTTGDKRLYEYRCTKRATGRAFSFDGDGWIRSGGANQFNKPVPAHKFLSNCDGVLQITHEEAEKILFLDEI